MPRSRIDDRIESLLKPTVYRLMDAADRASSKPRARQYLRQLLRTNSEQRKETLVTEYADNNISRRRFLRLLGVGTAGAVAGMGAVGQLSEEIQRSRTPTGNAAANSVHAVKDLGWDPNGNQDISGSLGAQYGSNTTIQVPPGEYKFTSTAFTGSANNFTLEGLGESHRDVVFKPPKGWRGAFLNATGGSGHVYRNFSINQYDDTNTSVTLRVKNNGFLIEDMEHLGFTPDDGSGSAGNQMALAATSNGAEGTIRRYYNRQGGQIGTYPDRQALCWVGGGHSGTINFEDCVLIEAGGSAIYGTRHNGTIRVNGGYYANNDHHDMRISNERGDQQGWVKNAVFFGDYDEVQFSKVDQSGGHEGGEGWWIEHGGTKLLIENCDFAYRDTYPTHPNGAHFPGIVQIKNYSGNVIFRECRFENSITNKSPVQGPSINAGTGSVTIEKCHFTGSSPKAAVASSTNCEVIDCCINMPNGGAINGARTRNVQRGGDCKEPDIKELESVYEGADAGTTSASSSQSSNSPC